MEQPAIRNIACQRTARTCAAVQVAECCAQTAENALGLRPASGTHLPQNWLHAAQSTELSPKVAAHYNYGTVRNHKATERLPGVNRMPLKTIASIAPGERTVNERQLRLPRRCCKINSGQD